MGVHSPSELAGSRGEPSYVWRSGQERRLSMIEQRAKLRGAVFLEAGCGVGAYSSQIRRRFSPYVEAFDLEWARVREAQVDTPHALVAAAEALPYHDDLFDTILSNEVIEHVADDRLAAVEMVRTLKPGGRIVLFCPNRWYPVEQHGHYWKGEYHFGNTPLINYLPDRWRNRLAPHVRTYTARGVRRLFDDQPVRIIYHTRIFGGYDNIVRRFPRLGGWMRRILYALEKTPLRVFGLSHLLVIEKVAAASQSDRPR
ncbi:MAG: class I SAM-dependent methyltransferase [Chloroflexi bacterium]|nr:MAG: class I SAM-dependent methyltransferase [Chloroflexota bacterium]